MNPLSIDFTPVKEPLTQHWVDVGYDPDANPPYYPVWEVRPVERTEDSLTYRTGSKRNRTDPD